MSRIKHFTEKLYETAYPALIQGFSPLKLCDTLILSLLAYYDVVYWPALLFKNKESLQKLQNSCNRYCYGLKKFDHVSAYYQEAGWLKLEQRFFVHLCTLIYKIDKFHQPIYLYNKLIKGSDIHLGVTRHNSLYCVPRHSTALFLHTFTYNAVKTFNSLPPIIKTSSTVASFKKHLNEFCK